MSDRVDPRALAAIALAVDPLGIGGAVVRAPAGSVRDSWLSGLQGLLAAGSGLRRMPHGSSESGLLGGLDVAATLAAGRVVSQRGLLAEVEGGLLSLPMAERCTPRTVGHLTQALDRGRVGVVALDESEPGEPGVAEALADRLGLLVDLRPCRPAVTRFEWPDAGDVLRARARLSRVASHAEGPAICCEAALLLGITSLRRVVRCQSVARAHAALFDRNQVAEEDLAAAIGLVFAPYALPRESEPAAESGSPSRTEPESRNEPSHGEDVANAPSPAQIADRIVAATKAQLPVDALSGAGASRGQGGEGRGDAEQASPSHGRPVGSRRGDPTNGARLHLLETLRAALPWQRIRGRLAPGAPLIFRAGDIRIQRLQRRIGETIIFVVDASGSAALHRLGEAKGAAELMLGRSYIRRDQVALVVFRGRTAALALAPTRSVARARRCLTALPGGGGTPLAQAIDAARELGERVRREGGRPLLVFLTDGQANVARDGSGGRVRARADALESAAVLAGSGLSAVFIDTSPRPSIFAAECAGKMRARLVPLPQARAETLHSVIESSLDLGRRA